MERQRQQEQQRVGGRIWVEGVWVFIIESPNLAASVKVFMIKCWGGSWGRG